MFQNNNITEYTLWHSRTYDGRKKKKTNKHNDAEATKSFIVVVVHKIMHSCKIFI